ncbi:hypothetical protein L9F63_015886, partial [Diploptera punctata]
LRVCPLRSGNRLDCDPSGFRSGVGITVVWNVPTFMCHRYGLSFSQVSQKYNITQNTGDTFRGNKMVILYDPGEFPALLRNSNGKLYPRNGGVPQLGNLSLHLIKLRNEVDELVPDRNFDGLGVIDFEAWRPIWRQNWASLLPYREFSRYVEEQRSPRASRSEIEARATKHFEAAARSFMLSSLELVKQMRPNGQWGYYTFPYCFNYTPKNMRPSCPQQVQHENSEIQWLFDASTALYPSLYLSKLRMTEEQHVQFMSGRLDEANRMAKRVPRLTKPSLYAYAWYKYHDSDTFLSRVDLANTLRVARQQQSGVVIWGSANDTNSRERCLALEKYVDEVLGPTVLQLAALTEDCIPISLTRGTECHKISGLLAVVVRLVVLRLASLKTTLENSRRKSFREQLKDEDGDGMTRRHENNGISDSLIRTLHVLTENSAHQRLMILVVCSLLCVSMCHREHKVHNIVLYPDKHSWCKTTPIKQVVAFPGCNSVEIDNNVCVGACFSYSIPRTSPAAPGELIKPYCDSCQPSQVRWQHLTLECEEVDKLQKRVQIIENCSCSSCEQTSPVHPLAGSGEGEVGVDHKHARPDVVDLINLSKATADLLFTQLNLHVESTRTFEKEAKLLKQIEKPKELIVWEKIYIQKSEKKKLMNFEIPGENDLNNGRDDTEDGTETMFRIKSNKKNNMSLCWVDGVRRLGKDEVIDMETANELLRQAEEHKRNIKMNVEKLRHKHNLTLDAAHDHFKPALEGSELSYQDNPTLE